MNFLILAALKILNVVGYLFVLLGLYTSFLPDNYSIYLVSVFGTMCLGLGFFMVWLSLYKNRGSILKPFSILLITEGVIATIVFTNITSVAILLSGILMISYVQAKGMNNFNHKTRRYRSRPSKNYADKFINLLYEET